jgi:predicted membrane chloride channel (bestrophin family)
MHPQIASSWTITMVVVVVGNWKANLAVNFNENSTNRISVLLEILLSHIPNGGGVTLG